MDGCTEAVEAVQETCCKKLVYDMHYEACVQSTLNYCATREGRKVTKAEARRMRLTPQQYEMVNFNSFSN